MRRAGQNPTDIEVQDMLNKIDDGSGIIDFQDFLLVMKEKSKEVDMEIHFKDAFRVFSKDAEGKECSLGFKIKSYCKNQIILDFSVFNFSSWRNSFNF